jgi:Flp pilus assembly pilin Flp
MWDSCAGVCRSVWEDEEAASLTEYIILVFLIAMVCVIGIAFLGFRVRRGLAQVGRVIRRGS